MAGESGKETNVTDKKPKDNSKKNTERKGLRFEVSKPDIWGNEWSWTFIGADGPVAVSAKEFNSESEARSDIAAAKKRMKACQYAKVVDIYE